MSRLFRALAPALLGVACGSSDALSFGTRPGDAGADVAVSADAAVDAAIDSPTSDGPRFDPMSVVGLVLWLDASRGVTANAGSVSAWTDQTTNKNDATEPLPFRQPMLQASSIHGRPALHFNRLHDTTNMTGDVLAIPDAPSLQWGRGDFYVVVVARFDNVTATDGAGLFFGKSFGGTQNGKTVALLGGVPQQLNGGVNAEGIAFNTQVQPGDYVTIVRPYNNGTPHAFAMQRVGALLDLRIDGASVATSASSGVDVSNVGGGLGAGKVFIGADYDATGLRLNGDIAEIIAVKGALGANDRMGLEVYVKEKYAL